MKKIILSTAIASVLLSTSTTMLADKSKAEPNLQQLQKELRQLKLEYLEKIQELEDRLTETEQVNQENQDSIEETQDNVEELAIDVSQQGNQKAANTFNPGVWMILNGRYVSYNDAFNFELPGFFPGEESGPGSQGFQIGESELNMSANVDDKFYAWTTLSFSDQGASVEEAYLQTLNMSNGLNIKFGEFFSDIGYLASKHTHTDDFSNRPLPYEAFLGGQYGDAGVQMTWLAPTETYWESGFELYRGDNFPSAGASNSGVGVWTAFTHIGGDIGNSQSWRAGISFLHADINDRQSPAGDSFTGTSKLTIADFIYKWSPDGNRVDREFKLQGEYFSRNEQGVFSGQTLANTYLTNELINFDQKGWYIEGVYRYLRQWRVGIRTARVSSDNLPVTFNGSLIDSAGQSPNQTSLMLDWTNSEFSRVRLQYDINNLFDSPLGGQNDNVWILQYTASFGAHGAHSF